MQHAFHTRAAASEVLLHLTTSLANERPVVVERDLLHGCLHSVPAAPIRFRSNSRATRYSRACSSFGNIIAGGDAPRDLDVPGREELPLQTITLFGPAESAG